MLTHSLNAHILKIQCIQHKYACTRALTHTQFKKKKSLSFVTWCWDANCGWPCMQMNGKETNNVDENWCKQWTATDIVHCDQPWPGTDFTPWHQRDRDWDWMRETAYYSLLSHSALSLTLSWKCFLCFFTFAVHRLHFVVFFYLWPSS